MTGRCNSKGWRSPTLYSLGYTDPSHFARAFQRMAGVSPREWLGVRHSLITTAP